MYLAPLNYDRYFKKVFSDTAIAKRFLEDFFDTSIDEIELLTQQHKITDNATAVEFDFRCKMDGRYVIVDMQQWYKPDVVHRFYTYHCINTALQLEKMPLKSIYLEEVKNEKERKIKDYSELLPVITLVWMVDDKLGFTDDVAAYTMTPEIVNRFISENELWNSPDITQLLKRRNEAYGQLTNNTKQLGFLQQNKIIFAFQKNIVTNKKYSKYYNWFELAEKTLDRANKKIDFLKYEEDKIFGELIRRISTEYLQEDDFTYIDDYDQFIERVKRYDRGLFHEGKIEGNMEGKIEGRIEGREEEKINNAINCIRKGLSDSDIQDITGLPVEVIKKLREENC